MFHELVADCLEYGYEPEWFVGDGAGLGIDGFWIEFDEDMANFARDGLEFVRFMASQPDWELFVETRVDISDYTLPGQFGTADVILVNRVSRNVIVFDWKYGKEPVYAEENYQLYGYALGAWTTLLRDHFGGDSSSIDVTLIIEQPRVPGAGGTYETTMRRLLEFGAYARRQAVLSQEPDAPRVPGPDQCKWCLDRHSCGARAKWHMEMMDLEFEDLDEIDPPELTPPAELTPERQSMLLIMRPMINKWLEAIHKQVYHRASQTGDAPYMKLVDGRAGARAWMENHVHKAETTLVSALGKDAHHEPALLSPAQAEKKLGKKLYRELVERFVFQPPPQKVLVPVEDRREAIRSVEDDFDDLDETHDLL